MKGINGNKKINAQRYELLVFMELKKVKMTLFI